MTRRNQRLLKFLCDDLHWHEQELLKMALALNPDEPMYDEFHAQWVSIRKRISQIERILYKISKKEEANQKEALDNYHYGY